MKNMEIDHIDVRIGDLEETYMKLKDSGDEPTRKENIWFSELNSIENAIKLLKEVKNGRKS